MGSAFKINQCGIGERIHWFRVYGRPIHVKNSMLFQKYPHSCGSYPNFGRVSFKVKFFATGLSQEVIMIFCETYKYKEFHSYFSSIRLCSHWLIRCHSQKNTDQKVANVFKKHKRFGSMILLHCEKKTVVQ